MRSSALLAVLVGVFLSFLIEAAARPQPAWGWRRPRAALLIHVGLWLLVFVAELAAFRRPWFAAANVDALCLGLVLVNNAKFHSLREAFVFQDFEYFTDALKHPRLYLPFLGAWRLALAVTAIIGAIIAGTSLEPSMTSTLGAGNFLLGLALLTLVSAALLLLGDRGLPATRHEPSQDLERLGLLAYWWRYAADERKFSGSLAPHLGFSSRSAHPVRERPDLVAIQSESFFDARRCFPGVSEGVLAHFDALKASAATCGTLGVPAWGANTVRTEFAFLSGIDPDALGVHRFNPYRRFAERGVPNVASYLKSLGYRCVCLHPYPIGFYRRNVVYPALGFDEFIDIRGFAGAECAGPFVSDLAVASKIRALLHSDAREQPLFVFAITMENHGPLHLESVAPGDSERLGGVPLPPGCDDLLVYLRHLSNADRMIESLRGSLEALPRPAGLCFFGDHVPIMAKVYAALGIPDGLTDYVVWSKDRAHEAQAPRPTPLKAHELGPRWLEHMGLIDRV